MGKTWLILLVQNTDRHQGWVVLTVLYKCGQVRSRGKASIKVQSVHSPTIRCRKGATPGPRYWYNMQPQALWPTQPLSSRQQPPKNTRTGTPKSRNGCLTW